MFGINAQRHKASKEEAEKPFWISYADLMTALMVLFLVVMSVALLAVTPDQTVSRQLCLLWGAHSVLSQDIHSYEEMVERASATALTEAFAQPADSIVVVAGIPFGEAGTTNNLRVVQLGRAA